MKYPLETLEQLVYQAFNKHGANALQARSTAHALVLAHAQGLASHGLSRTAQYVAHLQHGRVDGSVMPCILREKRGAVLIDAQCGFAFPACDLAVTEAAKRALEYGIAIGAVTNSHHFGAAGAHLIGLAQQGLVGIAMGNSPAAMPYAGGKHAIFGTNPIAAVFPQKEAPPILIDLSLTEVARGKIMVAAQKGEPIPLGWALDANGQPTTDAKAALGGSMLAIGGSKGAMLALMVELMVTALTGAQFGSEADSFFQYVGNRPRIGQAFICIDPSALAGNEVYYERVGALVAAMLQEQNQRLPGARRFKLETQAHAEGLEIDDALYQQLLDLSQA